MGLSLPPSLPPIPSLPPPSLLTSFHLRIRDSVHAQRKAEEKIEDLQKQLESSARTNQALLDEHQALQMAFNAHETKLRETEQENDRLVGLSQL